MSRKLVLLITLTLVLVGVFGVSINVHKVEAPYPIIWIKADGSIYPLPANITSSDNVTYTFTADINASIVVEKDNIVVDGAGYTVKGTGSGTGIYLSGGSNVTIKNMTIKGFYRGIWPSSNNTISGNAITNNEFGIYFDSSSNNTISGNNITNNSDGIWLEWSSNNKFYHNNFIDNTQQVDIEASGFANFWDNDVEGNYWSNYTGVDSDHDGIGDFSHDIDASNKDNYPLMGIFHSFNTPLDYNVNVISNSTIEDFTFFESNSTIKMYVSNSSATQSFGFCRVCIPKGLMSPPYTVTINDGLTEVLYFNATIYDNYTHRWIYFAYEHSTHEIDIIPEFPTWTSMLLILIMLTVAIAITKRRLRKN